MTPQFGFDKRKHLTGKRDTDRLFEQGSKATVYPFRAVVLRRDDVPGVRLLIVVRKRDHHFATARNRWRRAVREAYRLEQARVADVRADVAVVVLSHDMPEPEKVRARMAELLDRIAEGHI